MMKLLYLFLLGVNFLQFTHAESQDNKTSGSGLAFCLLPFLSGALQFSDVTHQTKRIPWPDLYGWNLPVRFTISPAGETSAKLFILTIPISSCGPNRNSAPQRII